MQCTARALALCLSLSRINATEHARAPTQKRNISHIIIIIFFFLLHDAKRTHALKQKQVALTISGTAGTPAIPRFALGSECGTRENARVMRAVSRTLAHAQRTRARAHSAVTAGQR